MSELKTIITLSSYSDFAGLTGYPKSGSHVISFDATDLDIYGYVEQFRAFLRAAGFCEKNIKDALGEF